MLAGIRRVADGSGQPLNRKAHASAACAAPVTPVHGVPDQAQQPQLIPVAAPHAAHN